MENSLPEDYFIRDFPYHKLSLLKEIEVDTVNRELEKIKDMTKNIDITDCCLVEEINYDDIIITKRSDYKKCFICTAFYFLENEPIELSMKAFDLKFDIEIIKLKLPEDITLKNNVYTSPNEGISNILKLSRSFEYIRDVKTGYSLKDIINKNSYISYCLPRFGESNKNIFESLETPKHPFIICHNHCKDIYHNFGDREIFINDEKYIRCDIIRPFLRCIILSGSFKKVYTEWIVINNDNISIQWIGDKILMKIKY